MLKMLKNVAWNNKNECFTQCTKNSQYPYWLTFTIQYGLLKTKKKGINCQSMSRCKLKSNGLALMFEQSNDMCVFQQ